MVKDTIEIPKRKNKVLQTKFIYRMDNIDKEEGISFENISDLRKNVLK